MKRIVLGSIFVVLIAVLAGAQTFRGAINGTVTDPTGGVVANAQVKASDTATGAEHTTTTTSDGQFVFRIFLWERIR
jgi:ABC-type branched-subunit amino acid transport system permease subunit